MLNIVLTIVTSGLGALFVTFWPSLYRNVLNRFLKQSYTQLELGGDSLKTAEALASQRQDLNLAATGEVLFFFNALRLIVASAADTGQISAWWLLAGMLIVTVGVGWLIFLHIWSDAKEFRDIETTAVSPLVVYPKLVRIRSENPEGIVGRIRVAGPQALRVWYTRMLCGFATFAFGIIGATSN